jgi:ppGpp synthetase/RelA/SpoT-type nucleotidyltranferase
MIKHAKFKIFKHVTKVVKEHEDILEKLSKEGSSLQKTTQNDMEHLLTELLEVKINHASSGQTIPNQD